MPLKQFSIYWAALLTSLVVSQETAIRPLGPKIQPRQTVPIPKSNSYVSRQRHASIILNGTLYIDGGEVCANDTGSVVCSPVNTTLAIDLTHPWTNETVSILEIQANGTGLPVFNFETLWPDIENDGFYAFGGEISDLLSPLTAADIPPASFWKKLVLDGHEGQWIQQAPASVQNSSVFTRPVGGAGAFGNEVGYLLGGYISDLASTDSEDLVGGSKSPISGILSYNITSSTWRNDSLAGFAEFNNSEWGSLQFAPSFGPAGLLFAVGGGSTNSSEWTDDGSSNMLWFGSVAIYEPKSRTWHQQSTSGAVPLSRERFCTIGVESNNGTFEIFVYGGTPNLGFDGAGQDHVYVLTIPGFAWFESSYRPKWDRIEHTCEYVGGGQMLSIGGRNPATYPPTLALADPFTQGLGVLDLNSLEWLDAYDPDSGPYTSPDVVRSWYSENGRFPSTWDSTEVQQLFTGKTSTHHSHTGAIIGGVIGAVVLLILIAAVFWWWRRREQRRPMKTKLELSSEAE